MNSGFGARALALTMAILSSFSVFANEDAKQELFSQTESAILQKALYDYRIDWIKRVDLARQKLFPHGLPLRKEAINSTIEVEVLADGHLQKVTLTSASGDPDTDAAIMRILYVAEPYAAFADEMGAGAEVLLVQSRWRIDTGGRLVLKNVPQPEVFSKGGLVKRTQEIERRIAELNNQVVESNSKRPRVKIVSSVNVHEYKYASYMADWERKIKKTGSLNYPNEARRSGVQGDLLLDVAINHDGTIIDVQIRRSSGSSILDDAARRIVHLSEPFAPLPTDISKEFDVLRLVRTWKFSEGELELK